MTGEPNLLGDYVRARRELVTPEQAGVPVVGVRRVPGLRREEVALLAGISVDYYLRLEQGRDRNPSVQVLESLARVLLLDDEATEHLLALGADRPRRRRRRSAKETVPQGVAQLVATLPLPALVEGRYFDVLTANPLATALSPRFTMGTNRLRSLFLDPAEQALYPGWEQAAAGMVAGFRRSIGTGTDDPRCIELVGELTLASPLFSRLWARHDVVACEGAPKYLDHPEVGGLWLNRERLSVDGAAGQTLVIYHPAPGTDAAEKLTLLAGTTPPPLTPRPTAAHLGRSG
ncbi:helix-turn-helix domain-containing protein [Streptomyces sp. XY006]|uniref:helix-turn-helix domain-containing protein n=1 Tax=Streptomyces sp. XY006 TaxID=2021410 RepID=UPI000B8C629C|nr:helix-turn-helix transcriptional regulator [Streptomyces sp. XY006]OXS37274.1 transcriptional regulator [Streptomyces sp. XY006]